VNQEVVAGENTFGRLGTARNQHQMEDGARTKFALEMSNHEWLEFNSGSSKQRECKATQQ
jgi:hypothetical protein